MTCLTEGSSSFQSALRYGFNTIKSLLFIQFKLKLGPEFLHKHNILLAVHPVASTLFDIMGDRTYNPFLPWSHFHLNSPRLLSHTVREKGNPEDICPLRQNALESLNERSEVVGKKNKFHPIVDSAVATSHAGLWTPPDRNLNVGPGSVNSFFLTSTEPIIPKPGNVQGINQKGRIPKCAQCQNHGYHIPVKNHKRRCPWKTCRCYKCKVTFDHRRVVATQVAIRRAIAQDEERANELNDMQSLNGLNASKNYSHHHRHLDHHHQFYQSRDTKRDSKSSSSSRSVNRQNTCVGAEIDWKSAFMSRIPNGNKMFPMSIFGATDSLAKSSKIRRDNGTPAIEPLIPNDKIDGQPLLKWQSSSFCVAGGTPIAPYTDLPANPYEIDLTKFPIPFMCPHFGIEPPGISMSCNDINMSVKALMEMFQLPPQKY